MLVQCQCGQKLQVKESALGKKVRCPRCEEVFTARVRDDAEDGVIAEETHKQNRRDRAAAQPARKAKTKTARPDDDDVDDVDDDMDADDRRRRRPGRDRQQAAPKKAGVRMARNIVAAAVLLVLVGVAVFVYWKKFSPSGTVTLELTMADVDIFVDGQKIDYVPPIKVGGASQPIDLSPGSHEIKVSKDGFLPFKKEVNVLSGKTEVIRVDLRKTSAPQVTDAQLIQEYAGTWVVEYSNKVPRVYTVTADGQVVWEQAQAKYSLSVQGGEIIMDAGPALERWQWFGDKLQIHHFNPRERYPREPPSEIASGERKTENELLEDARVLKRFEGKWKIAYTNNTKGEFTADATGRLKDGRKLVRIKGHVLLDYLSNRMDRLTLDGKQLKVEHYSPVYKYIVDPGNPQARGTAVRD